MNYGGERPVRRARHRPLQSCEIVGILPKEEAALTRALYASLLPEQPSKTTTTTAPSSLISSISPSSSSAAPLVITPADRTKSETPDNEHNSTCSRLSSPELSDPDCLSGVGDGGGGAPANLASGSCPSSPQSTNSLHLCLSSSSWLSSDSSISNSSCDSLFLPWSSGSDSKPPPHPKTSKGQAKKLKGPRKKLKRAKRTLGFGESRGSVGAAGRGKVDGGRGKRNGEQCKGKGASVGDVCGDKVPTAKKSACNGGKDANAPIQAQRKFAANHTPPVRFSLREVKAVTGLKEPPKTEDFITYLCLRGSPTIPKRLKKFESPWTPLRKRKKRQPKKSGG